MRSPLLLVACVVAAVGVSPDRSFAAYSSLIVFGDSLSDAGNTYLRSGGGLPGAGYPGMTFSNGPVWVNYAAPLLGVATPTPSQLGGTNYAAGFATTAGGTPLLPSVERQVTSYLDSVSNVASPTALYTVWAGSNDLANSPSTAGADQAVANEIAQVQRLTDAGAKNILVINVPNIGLTPEARAGGPLVQAQASALAGYFDLNLDASLDALQAVTPGVNLYRFDAYSFITAASAAPAAFGLTNVTDAAMDQPPGTPGVDHYLFWDDVHPTTFAHTDLAAAIVGVVPEPTIVSSALVLLVTRRRRALP